jgi:hypothetical protein
MPGIYKRPDVCQIHTYIYIYIYITFLKNMVLWIIRYGLKRRRLFGKTCAFDVKGTLRPTVSRPVCLGVRSPSVARDKFYFLLETSFRQLLVCYFLAPSLTRGRVCFCQYQSIVSQYLHKKFTLSVFDTVQGCMYNIRDSSTK